MVGKQVGNYLISGELARGGMGVVYRGRHVTLPREVVVKCIRLVELGAPEQQELRARFRREAHVQSQLDHPHIVRVYEFLTEGEDHFLVMEYVSGQSLRAMLDQNRILPAERAVALGAQALEGLAHAHGLHFVDEAGLQCVGVIHRDIKPANLLIDEQGNLKVTDFGIAKVLSENKLTQAGFVCGTVDYMSPEQIRGSPVDGRSDLYSLGLTLYESLCGRAPFERKPHSSDYEILKQRLETDPPPLRALNPTIPSSLADVVWRSLQKDPDKRWQTAGEFREALLAHSSGFPLPCAPVRQFERPRHKRRLVMAGTTALVLLVSAILAGSYWLGRMGKAARQTLDQPSIAVLPFEDISPGRDQEYFADGLAEELRDGLAKTPGLRVAGRTSSVQFKGKAEDYRVIGKRLNVAAVLEGSVRKQGNRARITVQLVKTADGLHLWSETFNRDLTDVFAFEEEVARATTAALVGSLLAGKTPRPRIYRTSPEAYCAYLQGKYFLERNNQESLEKAVSYFEEAIRRDPDYAPAWSGLAETRIFQAGAGYDSPADGFGKARVAAERALVLDSNLGEAHAALGLIQLLYEWDWAAADASFRRALALEPGNGRVVARAAAAARAVGNFDKAIALARQAIQIDPLKRGGWVEVGTILHYSGRQEEAAVAFRKVLELFPEKTAFHAQLCRIYLAQSRPQEALSEAEQEKDPIYRPQALALAYHALGRKRESNANLAELIAKCQTEAPFLIAEVYAFQHDADRAFEWLERAYRTRDAGVTDMIGDPLLESLVGDKRYTAFLQKLRLPL